MIQQDAYAKINLSLEVIRRRNDGYHDIVTVMQLIDLHDTLRFEPAPEITLECESDEAGAAEENLVYRAAHMLREATGRHLGARITLNKQIPVSAGLGGGSSDAAAALVGLSKLWDVRLPQDEMLNLAARLGSDVPFFLGGPTALVEGRGERVSTLPSPPAGWVVLVAERYGIEDKTRRLYESLDRRDHTDGILTQQLISSLVQGSFPQPGLLYNAFNRAAGDVFEGLHRVREKMARASRRPVHLSGSGPSLYVLFQPNEAAVARAMHGEMREAGLRSYLARTLTGPRR